MTKHSISAFFPAYNDVNTIGGIVRTMASILPTLTADYEIVVVNDGSRDGTGHLLRRLAVEVPFLKVIEHPVNRGYGAALISGFSNCSKDLIFYTDGDGQYDVKELSSLLKVFDDEVDIANGYKISRSDSWQRVLIGRVYQCLIRFMFHLSIRDVDCDFRLFRRSLIVKAPLEFESGIICVEMLKKFEGLGCRIVEVPVHHYARSHGRSEFFTFKHVSRVIRQLFVAWYKLVARPLSSSFRDRKISRSKSPVLPHLTRRSGLR